MRFRDQSLSPEGAAACSPGSGAPPARRPRVSVPQNTPSPEGAAAGPGAQVKLLHQQDLAEGFGRVNCRVRHSDGARAVRPPQRENDDDLHTCPESRRPRGPEPSRSALTEKRFPLSGPRRMPRRGTEALFLPRDTGQRQASIWQKARQIACQNPACGNAYVSQGLAEALQVSAVKRLRFLGPKPILDRTTFFRNRRVEKAIILLNRSYETPLQ